MYFSYFWLDLFVVHSFFTGLTVGSLEKDSSLSSAFDWLRAPLSSFSTPTLTSGTLDNVSILTLQNGLVSRTFALLPSETPAPVPAPAPTQQCPSWCTTCCEIPSSNCSCCANPGGKRHFGPDPGEVYPYFGKPCNQQSDCGQCTVDGTCTCKATQAGSLTKCCFKNDQLLDKSWDTHIGFATIGLIREGSSGSESAVGAQHLRASSPEAQLTLDGVQYFVGGLAGQQDFAFLNTSLLHRWKGLSNSFYYKSHTLGTPKKRYEWSPGVRHSDATLSWPPKGITLEIDFVAPPNAPAVHAEVVVTIVYTIYVGLPLIEKHIVVKNPNSKSTVMLDSLTTEILYITNEASGYWGSMKYGSLTAAATGGRIHIESEMSRGGVTSFMQEDSRCTTCTQGASGDLTLNSSYPLGPGAQLGTNMSAFHGSTFESFHTYVLLFDSDDMERQGLTIRKMYRILAPGITENPIFMHLTDITPAGIKRAVDQCVEVGFEMIIMSFGSGLNMESKDENYIESIAESVAYAHSKGIEIGGYNLMSSSRHVGGNGDCLGPDGKWDGASCLASEWSEEYFTTIKNFINATNFDMIETDGPFEGAHCSSHNHTYHLGMADSVWTQYERNMDFYAWCKTRGMYIHAPDPFYMRGINKDGMGYVETNWNLPLWEQINLARQNIYDGTITKIPSQGWMFVPIVEYHGGWPECCIEPVGFLAGQWEYYLALYFGTGVSPCYRGVRLYDELEPKSKALVQKYTTWNAQYRFILHADLIHLKRPDGNGIDAVLHVEPDRSKCQERAMLIVFNQNPDRAVNISLRVPLYYSGLDDTTIVTRGSFAGTMQSTNMTLQRDWSITLQVEMEPVSVAWWVFE